MYCILFYNLIILIVSQIIFQSIMRERKLLEAKRLDLDAARNKLRKTKNAAAQQAVIIS